MASGEVSRVTSTELAELPYGSAITSSGRISAVTEPGELSVHYPFPTKELVILDNALKFGSRNAKARFAVYIGDLGRHNAQHSTIGVCCELLFAHIWDMTPVCHLILDIRSGIHGRHCFDHVVIHNRGSCSAVYRENHRLPLGDVL